MLIKRIKRTHITLVSVLFIVSMKLIIKHNQLYETHKSQYIVKYFVSAIICES